MEFIPSELCYQFIHQGVPIRGYIFNAPDIPFIIAYMNKVFVDNGIDLNFSMFANKQKYPSLVRAPRSIAGDMVGPLTDFFAIEVSGTDEIFFEAKVAGINRYRSHQASVFEMFFVDKVSMVSGLSYRLSAAGLSPIDTRVTIVDNNTTITSDGVTVQTTEVGEFKRQEFTISRPPVGFRKWIAVTPSDKFPEISDVSIFGNLDFQIPVDGRPLTFPDVYLDAALLLSGSGPGDIIFYVDGQSVRHLSGFRENAFSALTDLTITESEFYDLVSMPNPLGPENPELSRYSEFKLHVITHAEDPP